MASAAVTLFDTAEPASGGHRPSSFVEFLVVGGATPFLFPLAWLARRIFGADGSELAVGFLAFHAAYVINDPHFSVTYLLFYRDVKRRAFGDEWGPTQRARYIVAGFVVPAVLALWGVAQSRRARRRRSDGSFS